VPFAELLEVVRSVEEDEAEPLKFDVMPDWNASSSAQLQDQRPWRESVPAKIGVYHAFIRSTEQNTREHKLFIVAARTRVRSSTTSGSTPATRSL
jgi:hypothetical protein